MTGRELFAVVLGAALLAVVASGAASLLWRLPFDRTFAWTLVAEGLLALLAGVAILGRAGMGKVTRIAFEAQVPWETERHYELGASLGYVIAGAVLALAGGLLLARV